MQACTCTKRQRAAAFGKWAVPTAILTLVPKCPACVAAYVLLFTGVGMSMQTAAVVRAAVIVACVAALCLLVVRALWKWTHR